MFLLSFITGSKYMYSSRISKPHPRFYPQIMTCPSALNPRSRVEGSVSFGILPKDVGGRGISFGSLPKDAGGMIIFAG